MRQHLLQMCDLTSGITRTLRLLPESRSPPSPASGATRGFGSRNPTRQCCVAFATPIDSSAASMSALERSDEIFSPCVLPVLACLGMPTGPETVRLSRGDRKWLARGQSGVLTPTGRCAPQDRNCGILRQTRWDGSMKAAAPSNGTCCASSCLAGLRDSIKWPGIPTS